MEALRTYLEGKRGRKKRGVEERRQKKQKEGDVSDGGVGSRWEGKRKRKTD